MGPTGRPHASHHLGNGGRLVLGRNHHQHIGFFGGHERIGQSQAVRIVHAVGHRTHGVLAPNGLGTGLDGKMGFQTLAALTAPGLQLFALLRQARQDLHPGGHIVHPNVAQTRTRHLHHPGHARARQIGHQTRLGMGHRLQQHHAKGLGALFGSQAKRLARIEQLVFEALTHFAQQMDARRLPGRRARRHHGLQLGHSLALPGDHQLHPLTSRHGLHQGLKTFVMRQPPHRQQAHPIALPGQGLGCVGWGLQIGLDAQRHGRTLVMPASQWLARSQISVRCGHNPVGVLQHRLLKRPVRHVGQAQSTRALGRHHHIGMPMHHPRRAPG